MRLNKLAVAVSYLVLSLCPAAAVAAFSIDNVANFGSRIAMGLPGYGIAQGSIFVAAGKGVGPDQAMQAAFPLPAADGLGGVSIKVSVGGATLDAIMVYVSANEVAAILPSAAPLGTGTVTVTNGDSTATAPITVVRSAFGMFAAASGGQFGGVAVSGGQVPALAFNVDADGVTTPNALAQAARPGQNVMINGTGLGAISSDETQGGATDVPTTDIKVWVGSKPATVVSAGRGSCCTGLDPTFPIPQGIAAWDVIVLTVPDGLAGCQVSVAVQTGNIVSNIGSIAVTPDGGACVDLNTFDVTTPTGVIKIGNILLTRVLVKSSTGGANSEVTADSGAVAFTQVDVGENPARGSTALLQALGGTPGSCTISLSRVDPPSGGTDPGGSGTPVVFLDAGPAINLKGPSGVKQLPKQRGVYSAADVLTKILVPGLPPINTGGPGFLEGGAFTMDNGNGGPDIAGFSVSLNNPKPLVWENMDQVTAVNRAQGVTVRWSGGDPGGLVRIAGTSIQFQGRVSFSGIFLCTERVSAGQFTVPAFVTLGLPQVATNALPNQGSLLLSTTNGQYVAIPGVDFTQFLSTSGVGKSVTFP